jgi:hypothetical protein
MPGEQILQPGDMARELSFAIKGTLVVTDAKGILVELISGEGTSPCIIGAVSFLLGVLWHALELIDAPCVSRFILTSRQSSSWALHVFDSDRARHSAHRATALIWKKHANVHATLGMM